MDVHYPVALPEMYTDLHTGALNQPIDLTAEQSGRRPVRAGPGWLLVPYLAWTTFALCLNFAVWQLNS